VSFGLYLPVQHSDYIDASLARTLLILFKHRDLALLNTILSPLSLGQLKNLHESCLVGFRLELLEGLCLSKAKSKHAAPVVMIIEM
jgi:hypothetical protein